MLYKQTNPQYQLETDTVLEALEGLSESDKTRVKEVAKATKRDLDTIAEMKSDKLGRKTITTSGVGNIGILEIIYRLALWQKSIQQGSGDDLRDPDVVGDMLENVPS